MALEYQKLKVGVRTQPVKQTRLREEKCVPWATRNDGKGSNDPPR